MNQATLQEILKVLPDLMTLGEELLSADPIDAKVKTILDFVSKEFPANAPAEAAELAIVELILHAVNIAKK